MAEDQVGRGALFSVKEWETSVRSYLNRNLQGGREGGINSTVKSGPGLQQMHEGKGDRAGGNPAAWRTTEDAIRTAVTGEGDPLVVDLG